MVFGISYLPKHQGISVYHFIEDMEDIPDFACTACRWLFESAYIYYSFMFRRFLLHI